MRKDQKAMMSLLCSHRRKLCANDACMSRHVSLHDHFRTRIAARHLLDVTRDESGAVLMTVTEIP